MASGFRKPTASARVILNYFFLEFIPKGYVLEHCGLVYRSQLRIAVFASFLFNRKARQEKKTPRTQRKYDD